MPELTDNQIADLRVLQHRCAALGAELVIIGAIAYQIHFPAESRHTGDIDFAVALDLDEFAELPLQRPRAALLREGPHMPILGGTATDLFSPNSGSKECWSGLPKGFAIG